ncbi:MAG: glycosyltransferase family 4 protein [Patescibacteria group bacterium]|nr:glycosyltransferase family 4 protein [Patescibacteria group bacterium]
MKIAILSPFEESVPPVKYGGTELVVYNLIEELVKLGHEVTLLGTGNSRTSAKLVTIFEKPLRSCVESNTREIYKIVGISKIVSILAKNKYDIIHNHIGWRFLPFSKALNTPVVTTLHGPLSIPLQQEIYEIWKKENYISISLSQQRPMPSLNYVGNVYNGIDFTKFHLFKKPNDYFAFLGRMSPEKGPKEAIEVAKKAGVRLIMAAKVDLVDRQYFENKVKPLIDGKQIKFVGEVDHPGKLELLGKAKALIAPIQWEEPFGLYFIESLACGTPVIALKRGSVPEILIDEKNGFICENLAQMCLATKKISSIDRKFCHDHAKENFNSTKMASNYLKCYKKVLNSSRI